MNYGISIVFRAIPLLMALFCILFGGFIVAESGNPHRWIAGPVVTSLAAICITLYCTAATIIRQLIGSYHFGAKVLLPFIGYAISLLTVAMGIYTFFIYGDLYPHSPAPFIVGHVITGVGFVSFCITNVALSSTRFLLISENSAHVISVKNPKAYQRGWAGLLVAITFIAALILWIYTFWILWDSGTDAPHFVAGHILGGLACVCSCLIGLVATIVKQTRGCYRGWERCALPGWVIFFALIAFLWGCFDIVYYWQETQIAIGFILIGISMVCFSIFSKAYLLAQAWQQDFPSAKYVPIIPIATALFCMTLALFLFEAAINHPIFFIPARVLGGLGAVCFTLFSIVSILECGTNRHSAQYPKSMSKRT